MTADPRFTERAHLREEAYADPGKLLARRDINRYRESGVGFSAWALAFLPERLGTLLDVGCGPGGYLRAIAATGRADLLAGVDLSPGMLAPIAGEVPVAAGDMQALPFPTGCADTTLCMHVLYHAPNIDLAIGELRRVTKPGGIVLVATNGADHQRAIRDVFDAAVAEISGTPVPVLSTPRRFRLEDAARSLGNHFASVLRHDLVRELVIPESGPVVTYLESVRSFHEPKLPDGVGWDGVVGAVEARVRSEISRTGAFRNPTHAGVLVCS